MSTRYNVKRSASILCAIGLVIATGRLAAEPNLSFIPLSDNVYRTLEAAKAFGLLPYLSKVRPYTTDAVYSYLKTASTAVSDATSRNFAAELRRATARFEGPPAKLYAAPLGEDSTIAVDIDLSMVSRTAFGEGTNAGALNLFGSFDLELSFGDRLYLDQGNRFDLYYFWLEDSAAFPSIGMDRRDLPDYFMYDWFLDTGADGFAGSASLPARRPYLQLNQNTVTQVSVNAELATLTFGRGTLDWGPSPYSNLCISRTAEAFDYLDYAIDLGGRGSFVWLTGFIQDSRTAKKMVTAHRIEYQPLDWLLLALYESVVYTSRFELAYINPVTPYYGSEVMLGDYDNKLGGMDAVFDFPGIGAQFYVSLFADDWDVGDLIDFNGYHNIGAYLFGGRYFSSDASVQANVEYIYSSHWMYTHREDLGFGYNKYTNFGANLGHVLGPNSHMARLSADWLPTGTDWEFIGGLEFIQRTQLTINDNLFEQTWRTVDGSPYFRAGDSYYFLDIGVPGSVLETTVAATADARYAPSLWPVAFSATYGLEYVHNLKNIEGATRWRQLLGLTVEAKL